MENVQTMKETDTALINYYMSTQIKHTSKPNLYGKEYDKTENVSKLV